jgi:hypothetical protein
VLARVAADPILKDQLRIKVSEELGALTERAFQQEASSDWDAEGLLCDPLAALVQATSARGSWSNPNYKIGQAGKRLALAVGWVEANWFKLAASQDRSEFNPDVASSLNGSSRLGVVRHR